MIHHFAVGGLRIDYFILPNGTVRLRQPGGNARFAALGMRLCAQPGEIGLSARITSAYPAEWVNTLMQAGLVVKGIRTVDTQADIRTFYAYNAAWERSDRDPEHHFAGWGLPCPPELSDYESSTREQVGGELGPMSVRPEEIPAEYWQARGIHLCPMDYRSQWLLVQAMRQANPGALITVDAGERYMLPDWETRLNRLLQTVDVFLPSMLELSTLCGQTLDRVSLRRWLSAEPWPHLALVVKMGVEGCLVRAQSGSFYHIPAYPAQVAQVVGAGDCFCGAFHVAYYQSHDSIVAALVGTAVASLLIEEEQSENMLARRDQVWDRVAWLRERVGRA